MTSFMVSPFVLLDFTPLNERYLLLSSSYQDPYYEGTNITGERVVNHPRTQLIDALKESYVDECF